jgi:choline kinase
VKAIILSAGQGKRLLPLTERVPKCMLAIAGEPLVARQIDALLECGVADITIVVGFGAELVESGVAQHYGAQRIRTLYNPFYTVTDNLVSCWVARGEMERDFLILNGDTLFAPIVLRQLLTAPERPITLAVSRKDGYDDDDMKVIRNNGNGGNNGNNGNDAGRLLHVGKKLPREEVNAESIGMMTFRGEGPRLFRDAMDRALRTPAALSQWYLSLIDALAKTGVVFTQEIPAAAWTEVDSPADLERASTPGAAWL